MSLRSAINAIANLSITTMDQKFTPASSRHFARGLNRFGLRLMDRACTFLDIHLDAPARFARQDVHLSICHAIEFP